ncbi:zf-PARP-domain-containing protein [Exidia glandulosa HHB12029]|uniref:Zf-PARP-domain-containing protein n=1 Tax=Exidia glandulosa HHB12029 TaxID=1314781 RepID=A0A165H728_EXIGL|nr:zf-PARP-domain-containing protein [Exidia glandulosa HHB12029]
MSDTESKRGGYRIEYASSGRAKCKGPKPCSGSPIEKGSLRLGTLVDMQGRTSFTWKHWGCVTAKVLTNLKNKVGDVDDLDGYEELEPADQEKIKTAWEEGKVADEDIPDSARKPAKEGDDEEEEKPKRKRAAPKKKKDEDAEDDDEEEKPKAKRAPRKKKEDADGEEKPKAKRAPRKKKTDDDDEEKPKKKPAAKRAPKKKKVESDEDGEDFGDAMDKVPDDEDDASEAEAGKKRKRVSASKPASKKKAKKQESEDEDDE